MLVVVRSAAVALVTGLIALGDAGPAAAHQQWFVRDPEAYPSDFGALLRPGVLIGVAIALVAMLLWRAAAAQLPAPELSAIKPIRRLAVLVPWTPRLLAAHLGASLLILSFGRAVLGPGIQAPEGVVGTLLLWVQACVGVLLIVGVLVRAAAVAIMLAGPVILVFHGLEVFVTLAVVFAIASFLLVLPPRRGGNTNIDLLALRRAALGLKLGTGVSLISLAVVEKLANPDMARAMLDQMPVLNILEPFGVSTDGFAVFAGGVELMLGLLVVSGALPQIVALVGAVPFTATVALFGATELVGHLPVYGVLFTFLALGSRDDTSRVLSRLYSETARTSGRPAQPVHRRKPDQAI